MKKIYVIILAAILAAGCNFLDVDPEKQGTLDEAFADKNTAEKFLHSCYSYIPNIAAMNGEPQLLGASDEATLSSQWDISWHYTKWINLGLHNPTNPMYNYWSHYTSPAQPSRSAGFNLYGAIRQCYTFLDRIYDVPNCPELFIEQVTAEAKFLIAYYHYILLRVYGPIVLVDGIVEFDAPDDKYYPKRRPYDECVEWIAAKLDEVAVELAAYESKVQNIQTGRPTERAAKAIKARMYLYAASPLFNGNSEFYSDFKNKDGELLISQTEDREKWRVAMEACKEAIDLAHAAGHSLYSQSAGNEWDDAYVSTRYQFVTRQMENPELIWVYSNARFEFQVMTATRGLATGSTSVPYGGISPSFKMIDAFYTANGLPIDKDPAFDYNGRYDATQDEHGEWTAKGHLSREPRFYAWVGYDRARKYEYAGGEHTLYLRIGEVDPTTKLPVGNDPLRDMYATNGYLLKKMLHPRTTFANNTQSRQDYMYPFVRLGELYLNYAEAYFEYNGNLTGDALEYLNRIRRRAGIPDVETAWAGIPDKDYREIIRRERTIELMFEGHRYFDARRWKTAHKEFPVKQKSWNAFPEGYSTANIQPAENYLQLIDTPEPTKVFEIRHYLHPIDARDVDVNHNLVQNPGWTSDSD